MRERETICKQYKKATEIVAATCGLCYICEVYTRLHRSKWNKMEHFQVWNAKRTEYRSAGKRPKY